MARNVQDVETLAFAVVSTPHHTLTPPHALSSREAACFPPTARAQDTYHCVSGSAVVPFECDDISTCLDGFENPPTFAQCESPQTVTAAAYLPPSLSCISILHFPAQSQPPRTRFSALRVEGGRAMSLQCIVTGLEWTWSRSPFALDAPCMLASSSLGVALCLSSLTFKHFGRMRPGGGTC